MDGNFLRCLYESDKLNINTKLKTYENSKLSTSYGGCGLSYLMRNRQREKGKS